MRSPLSLSYAPCKDTCPPSRYDNKPPASCTVRSISRTFQGPAFSATAKHGIGFSVAEILDASNFKSPYGSSAKDADREPTAAAVAVVGHLVSALFAPVYILGAIPKISVSTSCEQL